MKLLSRSGLWLALVAVGAALAGWLLQQHRPASAEIPEQKSAAAVPLPEVEPSQPVPPEEKSPASAATDVALPRATRQQLTRLLHHPKFKAPLKLSGELDRTAKAGGAIPAPDNASPKPVQAPVARTVAAEAVPSAPTKVVAAPGKDLSPETEKSLSYGLGAGFERYPRWFGAARNKTLPIPYLNINWQDRLMFSTIDGLTADLIHGERWHGGLVGTLVWGRSGHDLGTLAGRVPTRNNTVQAGAYLEYALTKELSLGWRVRHDIQGTGAAYSDIYADLDLPGIGPIEHSVKASVEGMNKSGMQRFFAVDAATAANLGTSTYLPGAGLSQYSVAYQAFVPTSEHTGFAIGASLGKLTRTASQSPLVRDFGSSYQKNLMAAFVVHY